MEPASFFGNFGWSFPLRRAFFLLALQLCLCGTAGAAPATTERDICGGYVTAAERLFHIPTDLLGAISVVESGRWDRGIRARVPWPWTINAEGRGHVFATKEEAVAAARALMRRGVTSFDVGCMQVNLRWHGDAFPSLEAAFDPVTNVTYAASFLSRLRAERGSWSVAVGWYHSRNRTYNEPYRAKVYAAWTELLRRGAEPPVRR